MIGPFKQEGASAALALATPAGSGGPGPCSNPNRKQRRLVQALARKFGTVITCDFEFHGSPELSYVLCMVAHVHTANGNMRVVRMWRDELLRLRRAPFDVGPSAVFIAYNAAAEFSCFLALDWRLPENVIDLYVEHRAQTNGLVKPLGIADNKLPSALKWRGLPGLIDVSEKRATIDLILSKRNFTNAEQRTILDYCETDVDALDILLSVMAPAITTWLQHALHRGRYMKAVARIERTAIPLDTAMYSELVENWEPLKQELIADVNAECGDVYQNGSWNDERFRAHLATIGILPYWPTDPGERLILEDETFKEMAPRHPSLMALRELRGTLGETRLVNFEIGSDGRNRVTPFPFVSITSRNQPSTNKCVFGPAVWMRGLIRPVPGTVLFYVDWASQEIAIAAGLSGDERLAAAYASGDVYMAFAIDAGLAPCGATKFTHPEIRFICKGIVLGVGYGMTHVGMARRAGITEAEARELLRQHQRVYKKYWAWSDDVVAGAMMHNRITTKFGWPLHLNQGHEENYVKKRGRDGRTIHSYGPNPRSLMNFPMQAHGAEMMRLAAIAATEAGLRVCWPVHDAFLLETDVGRAPEDVALMQLLMAAAGEAVAGIPLRTGVDAVRYPNRFMDEDRGRKMWDRVQAALNRLVPERLAA
jgi:DNA polymerase I